MTQQAADRSNSGDIDGNAGGLSPRAVTDLLDNIVPEHAARRLSAHAARNELSAAERDVALRLIRVMLRDAELQIRRIVAETLRSSPYLPHDMAYALARDVDAVALPILEFSAVLTDEDLLAVIALGSPHKQIAIAGRETVTAPVADALIETVNAKAVARLVSNRGARLDDTLLDKAATRFLSDPNVITALRKWPDLPVQLTERLIDFSLDSLRDLIAKRTQLSADTLNSLIIKAREAATLDLRHLRLPAEEAMTLAQHLKSAGRLTASLVLRALCTGDLGLFEASMASLAGIPVHNARMLIHDQGSMGLHALAVRAGMPNSYMPVLRMGLQCIADLCEEGRDGDRDRYRRSMIEMMLSQYDELGLADLPKDDLDYLLIRLNETTKIAA